MSLKNIIQILINDIFNLSIGCRPEFGNILKTTKDFILKNLLLSFMEIGSKTKLLAFLLIESNLRLLKNVTFHKMHLGILRNL